MTEAALTEPPAPADAGQPLPGQPASATAFSRAELEKPDRAEPLG
jgi:hypothetical protein